MKTLVFIIMLLLIVSFDFYPNSYSLDVKILLDENFYPYSYTENNELKGIYVDILKEIDKKLIEYNLILEPTPWNRGLKLIENGSAFAIVPPYYRPNERPYMEYSTGLLNELLVLVGKNTSTTKKEWAKDYYGSVLGVNRGFIMLDKDTSDYFIIEEARSGFENILKLVNNRIDYYINDKYVLEVELKKMKNLKIIESKKLDEIKIIQIIKEETSYIGYSKSYKSSYKEDFIKKVDEIIIELHKKKKIKKILENYLNKMT